MTDQRGQHDPTSFYDMGDTSALPLADLDSMPRSSAWQEFLTSAEYAAANGEEGADDARRQSVIDDGLAKIVAELDQRGIADDRYTSRSARDAWAPSYNEDAIWEGIGRARALDKEAFKNLPDTPEEYRAEITAPLDIRMAQERRTLSQSGWTAWGAGQFAGGLSDPINLVGIVGGAAPAETIARAALRDAGINLSLAAAEEPSRIIARAKRGETTSVGEVASDLAVAAGVGALGGAFVKGVEIGGRKALTKIRTPAAELADKMRSTFGEQMTEAEKGATAVLDRTADIEATSPFTSGEGTEHHVARMDDAMHRLNNPEPTRTEPPAPAVDPRAIVKAKIRQVESSGNDDAIPLDPKTGKPLSSAYGRYQFTEDTWKRYYVRRFGRGGLSDAQIAARRSDPALQDQLMDDMLADNARMLARIGARETPGNLYLAHFLGQGGAEAVLRATPDTPIERLIGRKAIEANSFLRGKTAGDVIEWASAKMGGDVGAPTLRRDLFDSDEEWAAAQRLIDEEEAVSFAARAEAATDIPEPHHFPAIAPDAEPGALDVVPAGEGVRTQRFYPMPAKDGEPVRLVTNKAIAQQAAPGREIAGIDVPRTHVDELAPPAEDFPTSGQRAMAPELAASIARPIEQLSAPAERSFAAAEQLAQRVLPETGKPGYAIEAPEDASFQSVVLRGKDGRAKAALIVPRDPDVAEQVGGAITYVSPEVRSKGVVTRLHNLARDAGMTIERDQPAQVQSPQNAAIEDTPAPSERAPSLASQQLQAFDDPFHGAAVNEQAQSLEHDVRMMAIENPDLTVRLAEDGAEERLSAVLDDIDADEETLLAARTCMQPPGA